jgi:hypothetical protein
LPILVTLLVIGCLGPFNAEPALPVDHNAGDVLFAAGQSRNWAGYVASSGTFTGVEGAWIVPQASGWQPFASGATWVGIGGFNTADLIQTGTQELAAQPGQFEYFAWIETLPEPSQTIPLAVSPGDLMNASITLQPDGTWQVLLANSTTGQSFEQNISYNSSLASADWIEEDPSTLRGLVPLDNFGTVHFSNGFTVANGTLSSIAQAEGSAITMVGSNGQVLAEPSALGPDGASFSVTRAGSTTPFPLVPQPMPFPLPIGSRNLPQPRGRTGLHFPFLPFGQARGPRTMN